MVCLGHAREPLAHQVGHNLGARAECRRWSWFERVVQNISSVQRAPVCIQNIDGVLFLNKPCPPKLPCAVTSAMRPATALGCRSWQSASAVAVGSAIAHFADALAPDLAKQLCVVALILLLALDFSHKIEWKASERPAGVLCGGWRPKSAVFAGVWLGCRCIGTVARNAAFLEIPSLVLLLFTARHLKLWQWLLLTVGVLPGQLRLLAGLLFVHAPHAAARTWNIGASGAIALFLIAMASPPAAFVVYLVSHIDYALYGPPFY